jgi:hypothetical protein
MNAKPLPDPETIGGLGRSFRDMVVSKIDQRGPSECWPSTCAVTGNGYGKIGFNKRFYPMPRAAYRCFVGPVPTDLVVLHSCDNPKCCNPAHLRLGTVQDNHDDMWAKGRARPFRGPGEKNGRAKLTRAQVDKMREMYAAGGFTYMTLAPHFGVAWQTVADIISGKHWR